MSSWFQWCSKNLLTLLSFGVSDFKQNTMFRMTLFEVALTTTGDASWDAAALQAAREGAPNGAIAAAREALETLDAGASTRAAAAAIADPVRADLGRSAAAGERAALVDLVGALGE